MKQSTGASVRSWCARLASVGVIVLAAGVGIEPSVARADGHEVVLSAAVSCADGQKVLEWTATAWDGDPGNPDSRANSSVDVIVIDGTDPVGAPVHGAFTAENEYHFSGSVTVAGGRTGSLDVYATAGAWGDGTPGSGTLTRLTVGLGAACDPGGAAGRLVLLVGASCVAEQFVAIAWAVQSPGLLPEPSRTNPSVTVTVTGAASAAPATGALSSANNFIFQSYAITSASAVGTVTVSAIANEPWADGTPPDSVPVTQTVTLDGTCAPQPPYAAVLAASLECAAGAWVIDWTATAWDGPTDASRTIDTVVAAMITIPTSGNDTSVLGSFGPDNDFSFSGSFTLPGTYAGQVLVGAQPNGTWGDGTTTSGQAFPAVFVVSGDCTAPAPPAAPTNAHATAGINEAAVSWTAPPVPPGQQAPTSYVVASDPPGAGCTVTPPEPLRCVVEHLPSGQPVSFTVTAHNDLGAGTPATTAAITPSEALGVNLTTNVAEVETGGTVTYTATAANGSDAAERPFTIDAATVSIELPPGAAVVPGSATCEGGGVGTAADDAGATTVTFPALDLSPGAGRTCSLDAVAHVAPGVIAAHGRAVGSSGDGSVGHEATGDTDVTVVAATPPSAPPTAVSGAAGDQQVTVSWVAPVTTPSAAPISAYLVTADPGGATCSTAGATTCTVDGLTNGTPYTFVVTAATAGGDGPVSDPSTPVTPTSPPHAQIVAATGQADPTNQSTIRLTVTFDQAVVGFDAGDVELAGTATPTHVTVTEDGIGALALAAGTSYTIEVSGMTATGTVLARIAAGAVTNPNQQSNPASDWFGIGYDVTPPVLHLPGTVTVAAPAGATGAIATWVVSTDTGETVVCTPASGSLLPVGTTTVSCVATDAAGNVGSGSFDVVVSAPLGSLPATGGDQRALLAIALALSILGAVTTIRSSTRRRPVP